MKKIRAILFLTILTINYSYSQDLITKKNGEDIKAKILEVGINEIKYKNYNNLQGPTYSILKQDLLIVRYENGTKDIFNETLSTANNNSATNIFSANSNLKNNEINENDMFSKGKADAKSFYKGENSGSGWISVATILTSPLLGVIPTALCATTEPNDDNLMYPNSSLMKNADYNKGYINEAHRIKNKKVWKAFGISAGVWLGLILIINQ